MAFVSMFWHKLDSIPRIIITLGSGICFYLLTCFLLWHKRLSNLITPSNLIAAFLQTIGLGVYLIELKLNGNPQLGMIYIFGIMLMQQGILWLLYIRPSFGFLVFLFGSLFIATTLDWYEVKSDLACFCTGVSILVGCFVLKKTKQNIITPFWYFIGSVLLFTGLFKLVQDTNMELLFLVFASYSIYLSVIVKSRSLLFVTVMAMLSFICYFTQKYFIDSIGWPITLVLMGIIFILLSAFAFKIQKSISQKR